jgi:drug/metabolite transporter (DMT)-like permease
VVFVVALGAAFCLGLGFVLQQHAASQAPEIDVLRLRLLLDLIRKPVWLSGIASMVVGQILGALALRMADITMVEPLLTANLLFALVMARIVFRQSMGWREWGGAVILLLGLTAFLVAADPHGGDSANAPLTSWTVIVIIAGISLLLAAAGRWRVHMERAMLWAAAAGLVYGLQDGFTRSALLELDDGVATALRTWQPYAVIAAAIIGLVLAQSAFETAPLSASLPAITVAEPVSGIVLGVTVFGEHISFKPLPLAFEAAGLIAMAVGVLMVAGSPLLAEARHVPAHLRHHLPHGPMPHLHVLPSDRRHIHHHSTRAGRP